jgi:hypothetical protein
MVGIMTEAFALTEEALALARAACFHDEQNEHYEACTAYDRAVLALDEILLQIPLGTVQWGRCVELREKYSNRMLAIREFSEQQTSILRLIPSISTQSSEQGKYDNSTNKCATPSHTFDFEPIPYEELAKFEAKFEKPPQSMLFMPYWQLRTIRESILHGGFIARGLFLPKLLWNQHGVKLSGIAIKSAAFTSMSSVLREHLISVKEPCSVLRIRYNDDSVSDRKYIFSKESIADMSLEAVHSFSIALVALRQELGQIQNSLSKSFAYIPELAMDELTSVRSSDANIQPVCRESDLYNESGDYGEYNDNNNRGSISTTSLTGMGLGLLDAAAKGMERASVLMTSSASNIGKSVKKAAEMSLGRINAIHSKISINELQRYCSVIITLIEQCQGFYEWYEYYESARTSLLELDSANCSPLRLSKHDTNNGTQDDTATTRRHLVSLVEGLLTTLLHITRIIKECLCEPLIRDIEDLHREYMQATTTRLLTLGNE